jgi:MYND finger
VRRGNGTEPGIVSKDESIRRQDKKSKMAATFQQGLPNNLTYLQCLELGYESPTSRTTTATNTTETSPFQHQKHQQFKLCCFQCGKQEETKEGQDDNIHLSRCSQCQVAAYCSRTCQINHWKTSSCCSSASIGHKYTCRSTLVFPIVFGVINIGI